MRKEFVDYQTAGIYPPLTQDYLAGSPQVTPFYTYRPELAAFSAVIEKKAAEPINRTALVNALQKQYAEAGIESEAVNQQIELLRDAQTFTVTTGHQLCLFTGPLYFIYKIISAINLAKALAKQHPSQRFVPIYWMASEDHDFAEINHIDLFNTRYEWPQPTGGMVGAMNTDSMQPMLEEMEGVLGDSDHAKALLTLFKKAYGHGNNLATATRLLVHELLGKYGVVVLDADDVELKRCFQKVMLADLQEHTSETVVSATSERLGAHYKLQVSPRAINFFYLQEGSRERIEKEGDIYKVLNTEVSFTAAELEAEVAHHPERFSPNVILRPLYQETILPNLAYIGGPSEVAYWLQLKDLFDAHATNFPMLLPRNSALLIGGGHVKKMEKLTIAVDDLFQDVHALTAQVLKANGGAELTLEAQKEQLNAIYNEVAAKAQEVDPTLKGAVEADRARQIKQLENMESRLMRAVKKKEETTVNQVGKLKEQLFPGGAPQERKENFIPSYLRWGPALFDTLLAEFDPVDFRLNALLDTP